MSEPPPDPDEKRRCVICGKPQTQRFRPFCSKRCADIDLGRWLKGDYAIPSTDPLPVDEDDEEDAL